jgi:hypothetical protein
MRTSRLALVGLLALGCGSSSGGNDAGPDAANDVVTSDTGAQDAGGDVSDAAAAACDPTKPFGAPAVLTSIDTADPEGSIWLSPDEKIAYVGTVRADSGVSSGHIFVAVRADLTDSFGPLTPLPGLAGAGYDESPSLTPDALTLVFDSNRAATSSPSDLFIATRINTVVNFGTPTALATLNSVNTDVQPNISGDGNTIYFASNRNNTQYDLFAATKGGSGYSIVTTSSPVAALNDAQANEGDPVPTADGLTMYYSTNKAGPYAVWVATRATTSDAFGSAKAVTEVNASAADRFPTFISNDGCRLYGSGTVANGPGSLDVWVATKPK